MNRPKKKTKLPDLSALNEGQVRELDSIKESLWNRIDELMQGEGYGDEASFNFKMQTWVEYEARTRPAACRELVLVAAPLIQRRFYTVMAAAMREESKVVAFRLPNAEE
jgi:hypothetical protein